MDLPFNNASACRVMGICSSLITSGYDCFAYGYTKGDISKGKTDDITFENNKYPVHLLSYFLLHYDNESL